MPLIANALRTRSHLTEAEVEKLLKVAKTGRYGARDHLMVLMAFRHGLRVSELCDLQWSDVDFKADAARAPPERLEGFNALCSARSDRSSSPSR